MYGCLCMRECVCACVRVYPLGALFDPDKDAPPGGPVLKK